MDHRIRTTSPGETIMPHRDMTLNGEACRRSSRSKIQTPKVMAAGSWQQLMSQARPSGRRKYRRRKAHPKKTKRRPGSQETHQSNAQPKANKFLDEEGWLIMPSLEEFCSMSHTDLDELNIAWPRRNTVNPDITCPVTPSPEFQVTLGY
ncbi:hypothetical protein PG984_012090 [Apiospora sp. TS-2023a]